MRTERVVVDPISTAGRHRREVSGSLAPMSRGRRPASRTRNVLASMTVAAVCLGRPGSPVALQGASGVPRCEADPGAPAIDYLVGRACPPAGFAEAMGYEPVLVRTSHGWRYTKPAWAHGNCSGPVEDTGPFWDFTAACQTHDYGYDLVRFGVGDRAHADELLHKDMAISCQGRGLPGTAACGAMAEGTWIVLRVGDAFGFDPEPVAVS